MASCTFLSFTYSKINSPHRLFFVCLKEGCPPRVNNSSILDHGPATQNLHVASSWCSDLLPRTLEYSLPHMPFGICFFFSFTNHIKVIGVILVADIVVVFICEEPKNFKFSFTLIFPPDVRILMSLNSLYMCHLLFSWFLWISSQRQLHS